MRILFPLYIHFSPIFYNFIITTGDIWVDASEKMYIIIIKRTRSSLTFAKEDISSFRTTGHLHKERAAVFWHRKNFTRTSANEGDLSRP